jgi:hypothetical protein
MIIEKRFFKGMDGDNNLRVVEDTSVLNLMNGRVGVTEYGRSLRVENVPGTTRINDSVLPPYGSHQTIGGCTDFARNNLIWFNYNTVGDHGIYCYEGSTGNTYAVLYDSQVTGGLNFSKTSRIDRNCKVIGDLLAWTDDNNEPKCINYIAGIKTNHASFSTDVLPYAWPMKYESTTLIKRAPVYVLQVDKDVDSGFDNNLIKDRAYQFTYRYHYRDRQISALAAYSRLMPFNAPTATTNCIDINLSFSEYIDNDILQIDICVRYGNIGKTFVVKKYNKDNSDDLAAIVLHNAGTTALGFRFYDDIVGEPVDDIAANTPYDNVPLQAKTAEAAKNRIFLGNVLSGYDTPTKSSLAVTLTNTDTGASGSFAGTWGYITLNANYIDSGLQDDFMFPFVRRTSDNTLYYFPSVRNSSIWNGGVGSVPATINLSEATQTAVSEATLVAYLKATNYPTGGSVGSPVWDVAYSISFASLGAATVLEFTPTSVNQFFKSNSTYLVNIAFYDRFRRKCGVIRNPVQVSIPIRTWAQTSFTTILQWTLSNTNAATEIPDWAYYYQIHITKNQTTRFFTQSRVTNATYAIKNNDGTYTYGNPNFTDKTYAVAFDISLMNSYGLGYNFTEGDFANIFFTTGDPYTLPVLGVDGNWVLLAPIDFGFGLNSNTNLLLELYTPHRAGLNEAYFEVGDMIAISNPTTSGRAYSTLVGQINGDTYAVQRTDKNGGVYPNSLYITEAMSPNDNNWQIWETDTGWPTFFDDIGQVAKTQAIVFTDTLIPGTRVNGLNKFQPLNQQFVDRELGQIEKLQLSSKAQEEGTVMLCIGQRQIASIYLGEVQLVGATRDAFVAQSTGVINNIYVLKGMLGTRNPESVVEHRGLVFGYDIDNGCWWQYSSNGLDVISRYNMKRFFQRYSKDYAAASTGNLDNINGFHHVPSGVDPFHKELVCTMPGLIYSNYATSLPSYTSVPTYASSIINRFDICDQLGKSMCFRYEENQWGHNFEYMAEFYETMQNKMFAFKNGYLYTMYSNTANWNTFFGTQYPLRICTLANSNPSALKDLQMIALESSNAPNYTVALTAVPFQQITDLTSDNYSNEENVFYAYFMQDRLSPNASGTAVEKMLTGDVLKDFAIQVMCEWQQYSSLIYVNFCNLGYELSKGQKAITNPSNS